MLVILFLPIAVIGVNFERSQKSMSRRLTQFTSETGVGTTELFLCSNGVSSIVLGVVR